MRFFIVITQNILIYKKLDFIDSKINKIAYKNKFDWLNKRYTKLIKIKAKYANKKLKNLL